MNIFQSKLKFNYNDNMDCNNYANGTILCMTHNISILHSKVDSRVLGLMTQVFGKKSHIYCDFHSIQD